VETGCRGGQGSSKAVAPTGRQWFVLKYVLLKLAEFWILIPHGVVGRYRRFGGRLSLNLQVRSHSDSDLEI
jgi:hypothetical protein